METVIGFMTLWIVIILAAILFARNDIAKAARSKKQLTDEETSAHKNSKVSGSNSIAKLKMSYLAFCAIVLLASLPVIFYVLNNVQQGCSPLKNYLGIDSQCVTYADAYPMLWLIVIGIEITIMAIVFRYLPNIYRKLKQ